MSCLCQRQNAGCHTKGLPQGSGSPVVRSMVQTQHFDKFFIISSPSQIISSPEITKESWIGQVAGGGSAGAEESWRGQALTQPTPLHPPHQHALQHATLDFFGGGGHKFDLSKIHFLSMQTCQCWDTCGHVFLAAVAPLLGQEIQENCMQLQGGAMPLAVVRNGCQWLAPQAANGLPWSERCPGALGAQAVMLGPIASTIHQPPATSQPASQPTQPPSHPTQPTGQPVTRWGGMFLTGQNGHWRVFSLFEQFVVHVCSCTFCLIKRVSIFNSIS